MIIPTVPPAAIVAAANSGSYFPSVISGCIIEPMVAVVPALEPDIAANIPQAPIEAIPSPPRTNPKAE